MPNVTELDIAMVCAEEKCRGIVRGIADLVSRKACVDPRRQKYVIFMAIARPDLRGRVMNESDDLILGDLVPHGGRRSGHFGGHGVTYPIVAARARVLVGEADKRAFIQV